MTRSQQLLLVVIVCLAGLGVLLLPDTQPSEAVSPPAGAAGGSTETASDSPRDLATAPARRRTALNSTEGLVAAPNAGAEQAGSRLDEIRGVVVDGAGAPLAGVSVIPELDRESGYERWGNERVLGMEEPGTLTSADGTFALRVGRSDLFCLRVSDGSRPARRVDGCAPGTFVRIVLLDGAVVEGVVTASVTMTPVADAVVRVHHDEDGDRVATVRTDAAGRFRAEGLLPGSGGVIVVPVDFAMPRWRDVQLEPGVTSRVEIEVAAGWELAGRVRDARTGDPIAGALVSAWSFLGKTFETDEQGSYRVLGARARPGSLEVMAPGYARTELAYDEPRSDLDIELERGMSVIGRVVGVDGEELIEAEVTVAGVNGEGGLSRREWQVTTDQPERGFRLASLRTDIRLMLQVRSPGFGAAVFPVPAGAPGGELDMGDLVLSPQALVAGRVVTSSGRAVPRARVALRGPQGIEFLDGVAMHFGSVSAVASSEGTFFIPELCAGTWSLTAYEPGGRATSMTLTLASGEARRDLLIELPGGQPLRGRVTDAEGQGIAHASVRLTSEGGAPGARLSAECDDTGLFEFLDVPEGRFTATAFVPGEHRPALPEPPFATAVVTGLSADGSFVEIRLDRLGEVVSGRVLDTNGEPQADVYVCRKIGPDLRPANGVLTDESGTFELPVPSNQPIELLAWRTRPLEGGSNWTGDEWVVGRAIPTEAGPAGRATTASNRLILEIPALR